MELRKRGLLFVLLFSLVWAVKISLSKLALSKGVLLYTLIFQVLLVATLTLLPYCIATKRNEFKKIGVKRFKKLVWAAFIGSVMANITGYYGLQHSTSINYGFLIKTAVVFTIILAYIFLKEKVDSYKVALMALLIVGAYLITTDGKAIVPRTGDLLIVFSAFCYAFANIIIKPMLDDVDPDIVALLRVMFGAFFMLAVVPFFDPGFYIMKYPILVISTGVSLALTQLFLNKTLAVTTVSYMSMMSMITPVLVTIIGLVFLKESVFFLQFVGGILIIVSSVLIHRRDIWKH
ncbi:MAG: DMT family transporter [Candidatus Methanofastidiosia archaeon]